jgi:diaminobutyrate acetyltransferase
MPSTPSVPFTLRSPTVDDGAALWRLARAVGKLDVNSSYAYLLWCRDFAATSVIALSQDEPAGFVTGYRRPDEPEILLVWQVGVSPDHQRLGLAAAMLDHLLVQHLAAGGRWVETTVTSDNLASLTLFRRFAERHGTEVDEHPLFEPSQFPDPHEAEHLLRIGPFDRA